MFKWLFIFLTLFSFQIGYAQCEREIGAQETGESMKFSIMKDKLFIGIGIKTSNREFLTNVPPLWERFYKEAIHRIPNRIDKSVIALYTDYEGDYNQPFYYLIGCEVSSLDEVPAGMEGRVIPHGAYALFKAEGLFPESMGKTWGKIWESPLPRAYKSDFEVYGPDFNPMANPTVNIYIGVKS